MEIVYPPRRQRDCSDDDAQRGDDYMDDIRPLLEEDIPHGSDASGAQDTADMIALLEENARLRGLVVKLSSLILKSVADQR
jgi:hypothetical protein